MLSLRRVLQGIITNSLNACEAGAPIFFACREDDTHLLFVMSFTREPGLDIKITERDIVPPSLARTEWEHINRVLADCDGNISETAKRLGIHRRTLQRKLYKYPPKQ